MKFEELRAQIKKDTTIDKFDLTGEQIRITNLFSKYLCMCRDERLILKSLENKYKVMLRDKVLYYIGEADDETYELKPWNKKVLKSEVSLYTNADEDLIALSDKIHIQKEKVECIEQMVKFILNVNFSIKNAIDNLKFTQGC